MAVNQIQKVSAKHDAILEYIFANPTVKMGDVARYFGVTQTWLSIIVNSDVFKAKMQARGEEYFGGVVVPLRARMHAVLEVALDKVGESLEANPSGAYALETADKILHRLGYAPQRAGVQINQQKNTFMVSSDTVAQARASFGRVQDAATEALPCTESDTVGDYFDGTATVGEAPAEGGE